MAREVAEQLMAEDPLAAQLETEYGIDEIPSPRAPVLAGLSSGISFAVGAGIPLTITVLAPLAIDAIAVLLAVVVSLCLTSIIAARSSHLSASRTVIRSLLVGLGALSVSYAAGLVLLPPAD
ncbi:MAG TPA: VIT1/CCC1 transporter family protein [Microlunatus sp.]|jgi:VIT1/CCC1 family predicted Fe2+/Mn2+ transporter|nr:VIT1/CCC1 transporter family protein [Microlunatus sp.]